MGMAMAMAMVTSTVTAITITSTDMATATQSLSLSSSRLLEADVVWPGQFLLDLLIVPRKGTRPGLEAGEFDLEPAELTG